MDGEAMVALVYGAQLLTVVAEVADRRLRDRPQRVTTPPSATHAVTGEGMRRHDPAGRPVLAIDGIGSVETAVRKAPITPAVDRDLHGCRVAWRR